MKTHFAQVIIEEENGLTFAAGALAVLRNAIETGGRMNKTKRCAMAVWLAAFLAVTALFAGGAALQYDVRIKHSGKGEATVSVQTDETLQEFTERVNAVIGDYLVLSADDMYEVEKITPPYLPLHPQIRLSFPQISLSFTSNTPYFSQNPHIYLSFPLISLSFSSIPQ